MNVDDLSRLLAWREARSSVALDGETQTPEEPLSDERWAEIEAHVMGAGPTDLSHVIATALMAPELLAEVERLRARVAELEALLRRVEWQGRSEWDYDYAFCPECQSPENDGHTSDCELAAALREAG